MRILPNPRLYALLYSLSSHRSSNLQPVGSNQRKCLIKTAKPLFIGSIPIAASSNCFYSQKFTDATNYGLLIGMQGVTVFVPGDSWFPAFVNVFNECCSKLCQPFKSKRPIGMGLRFEKWSRRLLSRCHMLLDLLHCCRLLFISCDLLASRLGTRHSAYLMKRARIRN